VTPLSGVLVDVIDDDPDVGQLAPTWRLAGGQKKIRIPPTQRRESFGPPDDAKTELLIEADRLRNVA